MTLSDHQRIERLLKLANAAAELEFIDPDLVVHFSYLREDLGLAKLLLLIQEHVRTQESQPVTQIPETDKSNQDQPPVQRM
ncbi:MAG TPA: hypothetical protein VFQ43_19945 [Nitrososphaera sp.]|nr:hypothetical protein [Nitrososphaera sp.]